MKRIRLKLFFVIAAALAAIPFAASALASPAPPAASIADHHEEATLVFHVGIGAHVHVVGAGGGPSGSNCTSQESHILISPTKHDPQSDKIAFIAKDGGSCRFEESWSNFHMSVNGPGDFHGEGTVFLGQKAIAGGYAAYCDMRVGNRYTERWHHLRCEKVNHRELKITKT